MMDVFDLAVLFVMDNYHVRLIASRILKSNEKRFRELERRTADVIEAITNSSIKYKEEEEKVDMCQAIQEMRMEERRLGELEGEKRGEERGEKRGEKKGEKRGELKKAKEAARNLYGLGVEIEKIAQGVGHTVETVKEWIGFEA